MLRKYSFNQKHLKRGAKASIITNVSHSMQIPRRRPLTLRDRMNFLPLTEPNPTENEGELKVSQHVDAGNVTKPTTTTTK
jgi:hypothetical protein